MKCILNLFGLRMAGLHTQTKRADRPGDQHLAGSSFTCLAGDFYAAAVETLDFFTQTERGRIERKKAHVPVRMKVTIAGMNT